MPASLPVSALAPAAVAEPATAVEQALVAAVPSLRLLARQLAQNANDADDVVQQTLLTACSRIESYDPTRPLLPWLHGILKLVAVKHRQSTRRVPDFARLPPEPIEDPLAVVQSRELRRAVHRALERLPLRYRAALRLRLLQDLAPEEIADALRAPASTVRVWLHRGLHRLRTMLPATLGVGALRLPAAPPCRSPRLWWSLCGSATLLLACGVAGALPDDLPTPAPAGMARALTAPGTNVATGRSQPTHAGIAAAAAASASIPESTTASPVDAYATPVENHAAAAASDAAVDWRRLGRDGPTSRYHAGAVLLGDQRLLLFGGETPGQGKQFGADTWLADASGWHRLGGPSPMARSRMGIAFDAARGQAVLFGGRVGRDDLGDTWTFDGAEWRRADTGIAPPARYQHGMVYDSRRQRVVLHGGLRGILAPLDDTWEWDGTAWHQTALGASLPPLAWPVMAFDRRRSVTVLHGGRQQPSQQQSTFEFDGREWTAVATPHQPPGRTWPAMVYDSRRELLLLHGGLAKKPQADVWAFDGADWFPVAATSPAPRRAGHTLCYDAMSDTLLAIGNVEASPANDAAFASFRVAAAPTRECQHPAVSVTADAPSLQLSATNLLATADWFVLVQGRERGAAPRTTLLRGCAGAEAVLAAPELLLPLRAIGGSASLMLAWPLPRTGFDLSLQLIGVDALTAALQIGAPLAVDAGH